MGSELWIRRDFGMLIDSLIKVLTQCVLEVTKDNSIFEIIRNSIVPLSSICTFGVLCPVQVALVEMK